MTDFLERWACESEANAKLVAEELLIAEVTEAIWEAMEENGCSKTDLARRLGATKGHISQVLSGSRNMTLRTLADICLALDLKPAFQMINVAQPGVYRSEPPVRLLKGPKIRYINPGNTTYPQGDWGAAA